MKSEKAGKFASLAVRDKLFLLQVFIVLMISKLVLLVIPLRRLAAYLGQANGKARRDLFHDDEATANRIKLFIDMAGANVPWSSVCLDQALAAMYLLNHSRIPCCLYLGVKKDHINEKLDAHAWVECGGRILVGGKRSKLYQVVVWFAKDH